jgi:uncharacterized repeat protein (TIGR02543 family)
VVQLTAVPAAGWSFANWTGDATGTANPVTVTIDGNKTVTAHFSQTAYSLTVNTDGSGTVNRNNPGPYHYGDVVQLTAVPAAGWSFANWTGDATGTSNPVNVTIDGNKVVTATFSQMAPCSISINDGAAYTGNRQVWLSSNATGATEMLVSNEAGFAEAIWQSYQTPVDWTLSDPGQHIATLLVYVRFRDASASVLCGGVSLIDDIIYDPLPPSVAYSMTTQTSGLRADAGIQGTSVTVTLHITATDQPGGSGVSDMQISTNSDFADASWQPFSATVQINAQPGQTLYVQVRDGAGNVSDIASDTVPEQAPSEHKIYLPFVSRDAVSAPDLTTERVIPTHLQEKSTWPR